MWESFLHDNWELIEKIKVLCFRRSAISKFKTFPYKYLGLESLILKENEFLEYIEIVHCIALKEFDASRCNSLKIVDLKGDFKNLVDIQLQFCKIESINLSSIFSSLRYLSLYDNHISIFKIPNAPNLEYILLHDNWVQKLYIPKSNESLNIIDLSNNISFSNFEFENINFNSKLYTISLINTNISLENLRIFRNCENLTMVDLGNTPVQKSYPEEVKQGWVFLKTLFEETKVPFLHQKILLLGDPNIGKSNLLFWWKNKLHPIKEEDMNITHGVKYSMINQIIKTNNNQEINLHVWDFGGQDYFHATHQLFFSKGSLNLLLWAIQNPQREGKDENLYGIDYWLRCIQQLSQNSKSEIFVDTILIQNKFDLLNPPKPAFVNQLEIAQASYSKNLNLFFTNMLVNPGGSGTEIPKYLSTLEEQISDILQVKDFERPKTWVDVYAKLLKIEKPVINLTELDAVSIGNKTIAQYFHDKGLILYFENCCEDKVFIKPQVFLDFLYNELFKNVKDYRITKKEINHAIKISEFKGILTEIEIINILKDFNLVFEIPEQKDIFFIPQYLPEKNDWIKFFEKHQFKEPDIIIKSDYFLMNQAMLTVFKLFGKYTKKGSDGNLLFWKDGIVIEIDSNLIEIILNRKTQSIEIYFGINKIDNQMAEIMVAIITNPSYAKVFPGVFSKSDSLKKSEMVLEINGIFHFLNETKEEKENYEVSLLKFWNIQDFDVFINNDNKQFVSFKQLRENANSSIPFVNVYNLEDSVLITNNLIKTEHITSIYGFNQYLEEKNKGEMKKLMISYSKDDLKLVNEFKKHLEPLIRNGDLQEVWYCTDLEAGQAWKDEIEPRLKTYDIVCFMISSSFYNTKYIRDVEIKILMDRFKNEENKPIIVPIILQPYHWTSDNQEYNLGKFTALPYTAKPVSTFNNREEAWHIIGECLRVAIRNKKFPENEDYWLTDEKELLPKDVKLYFEKIIKENKGD